MFVETRFVCYFVFRFGVVLLASFVLVVVGFVDYLVYVCFLLNVCVRDLVVTLVGCCVVAVCWVVGLVVWK